jgi:hypothetical protein
VDNRLVQPEKYPFYVQECRDCFGLLPAGFIDFNVQKDEDEEVKWFLKEELRKELKEKHDDFLKGIHERMNE